MKRRLGLIASIIVLSVQPLWAHHPAEDIVDADIYAIIDESVADTPHATLTFDDMGNTVITTESVSDAEDLLASSLLAAFSLLADENTQVEMATYGNVSGEELTITITFVTSDESEGQELMVSDEENKKNKRWTERDDWGCPVKITINQELPIDPIYPEDEMD